MQPIRQNKRKGRQLLVAAVGIASVSYVGTLQGCADVDSADDQVGGAESAESLAGEDGAQGVAQAQQALTISNAAINQAIFKQRLPPSGNLMPGPGGTEIGGVGGGVIIKVPIPVGNLMVVPVDQLNAVEALDQAALLEQP